MQLFKIKKLEVLSVWNTEGTISELNLQECQFFLENILTELPALKIFYF